MKHLIFLILGLFLLIEIARCEIQVERDGTVENIELDIGKSREGSRTDDEIVQREEEAIKLDGLNVAQMKELRDKAEKFTFQAEVNRMMKLIINSLYRNKEIFLRELISNASDALDKIRLLSLTDPSSLETNPELNVRIKADKENNMLHITDSGIGMTKVDLVNNLGTIAKSGTAEFLNKMQEQATSQDMNDMIGQFGVGFYSAFLVAEKVIVTTKHNDDNQYIWESDASSYSIADDPRGPTLKRGTTISLQLKPEAVDFLEAETIKNLVKKYSQFINFPIYLWDSKVEEVEEEPDEDETEEKEHKEDDVEDDAQVEESKQETPTKKIPKTIWSWVLLNEAKPIWSRNPADVAEDEYDDFYRALTRDTQPPLAHVHFVAEGEVSFRALLFIPKINPSESFNKYGTRTDNIKLFVRRVFITDSFQDIFPNYLSFIQGVVDSDDLPLNVSREELQQHKLIKVLRKKLVRKALDAMKKIPEKDYAAFWKEFSTNIKLGVLEDAGNRARLAKLLMFRSSKDEKLTSLEQYVARQPESQPNILYLAGASLAELRNAPHGERARARGHEILYLTEAVDEYTVSSLPDFQGRKFVNLAKETGKLEEDKDEEQRWASAKSRVAPLVKWLSEDVLKDQVAKVEVSTKLQDSPAILVAPVFGWTGNMERLAMSNAHQKSDDPQRTYYLNQKKTLEINPLHPVILRLLDLMSIDTSDPIARDSALTLYQTAVLRSGYMLRDSQDFALRVDALMRHRLGVPLDATPEMVDIPQDRETAEEEAEEIEADEDHDEL